MSRFGLRYERGEDEEQFPLSIYKEDLREMVMNGDYILTTTDNRALVKIGYEKVRLHKSGIPTTYVYNLVGETYRRE